MMGDLCARFLLLLLGFLGCTAGIVEMPQEVSAVLGKDILLPCYYRVQSVEKVTQVAWSRGSSSSRQNMDVATLNPNYGQHIFPQYEGRVKQMASMDLTNASIMLKNAVQADEGTYKCRVNTFPAGSFEDSLRLTVLVPPLPSLNPVSPLVEGQGRTMAASCTAEGNPIPTLTWETEVKGTNVTRTSAHSRSASITSEFYLEPSRDMNKKTLTCVVSHPGLYQEKRVQHILEVQYLSDVSIRGHEDGWYEGREGGTVKCFSEGIPAPKYSWSRVNGSLPRGVKIDGDTLIFLEPLTQEDAGVYVCRATNDVTSRHSSVHLNIAEGEPPKLNLVSISIIAVAVVTIVLLTIVVVAMILVNRYHKRKTKRLSEKIEELSTLSRECSRRGLSSNTASADIKAQGEEADRRSYSTLTTVREIETQTELFTSAAPAEVVKEEEEGPELLRADKEQKEEDEEEKERGGLIENQPFIKQAMTHFYKENGTLRAKPSTNGIYINGRGHLV
ncbi:nectin-4 isoform X2 [Microcaecilia unicolor]|uniref:Nectin-4 n=1 Tax=Microcaecilia unicolor TaxID=1415580 RepID=A0A6P7WQG2_9AMPH|nr:nectin-4 isoform X2 [Microcaecilia unicolor]